MLEISNLILNFINGLFGGSYAYLASAICLLSYFAVLFIEILVVLITKIRRDCSYFLCFGLVVVIASFIFGYKDLTAYRKLFTNESLLVVYMCSLVIVVLLSFTFLRAISSFFAPKLSKKPIKEDKKEPQKFESSALNYFEADKKLSSNYLDVSYVRQLIYKLKDKDLSDTDLEEVEELEVFLLNFACRQPSAAERPQLSSYLSSLIKKLAKYAV